jgi:SAM-dependent methyltransferase
MEIFDYNIKTLQMQKSHKSYDPFLHNTISLELIERLQIELSLYKENDVKILELGYKNNLLQKNLSTACKEYITSSIIPKFLSDVCFIENQIPIKDNYFDIVIANLNLHSVNDIDSCLSEIKRVLKKGGRFIGAVFGSKSLLNTKMQIITQEAEESSVVHNRFFPLPSIENVVSVLKTHNFDKIIVDSEEISLEYTCTYDLFKDLKNMCEANFMKNCISILPKDLYLKTKKNDVIVENIEVIYFCG